MYSKDGDQRSEDADSDSDRQQSGAGHVRGCSSNRLMQCFAGDCERIKRHSILQYFKISPSIGKKLKPGQKLPYPDNSSIEEITSYLTSVRVTLICPAAEGEEVDAGTAKPIAKGRQMYVSRCQTLAEFAKSSSHVYFRGNCDASMRNKSSSCYRVRWKGQICKL